MRLARLRSPRRHQGPRTGSLAARDCRVQYQENGRIAAVLTIGRDAQSLEAARALELRV